MTTGSDLLRRVLVTRPEPGASATARALSSAGFEPVVLPLTEIRTVPAGAADLPSADAVAVTSANAIRHASPALSAGIGHRPLFAVGETTAMAALDAGFNVVAAGTGDAAGLATAIGAALAPGSAVLYLCGKVRKPDLELELRNRGVRVIPIETYDTVMAVIADDHAGELGAGGLFAVLIYSAEAAKALTALLLRPAFGRVFGAARLVAISRRAAAPLELVFAGRIVVAREPTEAAMLEALIGEA